MSTCTTNLKKLLENPTVPTSTVKRTDISENGLGMSSLKKIQVWGWLIILSQPHLVCLCIAGLGNLLRLLCGEADAEEPEQVSVSGLDISIGLNERLPLLDHGAQLVCCQVHAIEVGEAVLALHLLADESELLEATLGILLVLQISQGDLVDTTLQAIRCNPVRIQFTFGLPTNTIGFPFGLFQVDSDLVPWVLLTSVFPTSRTLKMDGAFTSYQSLRVNGSITFFLAPFLPPLERPCIIK